MSDTHLQVVYRIQSPFGDVESRTEALLLEQTVELSRRALHDETARALTVGSVLGIECVGEGDYRVTLAQPRSATADDPAQLLNVLFGNSSLQPDVVLEDVTFPDSLALLLGGPRAGLAGLRRLVGVADRAMTMSALKPMGLSVSKIAALCHAFALSGLDFVKDDHGLADHAFCPFVDRVRACLEATDRAAQTNGRRACYVPNLIGSPETVLRQARIARELGVEAVMVSPMLLGLPFFNELVQRHLDVPVIAHPSFGGVLRISPVALLGQLFPLFGADAVIFPNFGGRFSYSHQECGDIARALRRPRTPITPSVPVPAGGIKADRVGDVLGFYGAETILLIGGSLLESPDEQTLRERSRQFANSVQEFPYTSD